MLFFLMGITATPSVIKFCTSLELLHARGVTVPTADVTLSAVWRCRTARFRISYLNSFNCNASNVN